MSGDAEFVFNVQRQPKDFDAVIAIASRRIWGWWRPLITCGLLPLVAILTAIFASTMIYDRNGVADAVFIDAVVAAAVFGVALAVWAPWAINRLAPPKFVVRHGEFLTPVRIALSAGGINQQTKTWATRHGWESALGLEESKKGIFIFTDKANGVFIPTLSIGPDIDREQLRTFVNAQIEFTRQSRE